MATKGYALLNSVKHSINTTQNIFKSHKQYDRIFSYSSSCIPKPIHIKNKNYAKIQNNFGYGGEDAYFALESNINNNDYQSLFVGISDGIGSAENSANYSQQLMLSAIKYLSNIKYASDNNKNLPHEIAKYSSKYVNINKYKGSATLCILNITKQQNECNQYDYKLNGFNLGDSGFCVYRGINSSIKKDTSYYLQYSSPSQSQTFGVPYHLGSNTNSNTIHDGHCLNNFKLQSNDIIIAGTDGLWDNLYQNDIEQILSETITKYNNDISDKYDNDKNIHHNVIKHDLTHRILKRAYYNSIDREISTPWSQSMTESFDMIYNGGKSDDITCVVVFVH